MLISKLCNGFIAQSRVALPSLRPKIKLLKRIPCSNLNIARFSSISYLDVQTGNKKLEFGQYDTIASAGVSARQFTEVKNIGDDSKNGPADGEKVWVRGRIHSIRSKGNAIFAVIRSDAFYTIQICHFKDKSDPEHSKQLMKFIDSIPLESVVDVYGEVASAIVKSCSQTSKEIAIEKIFIISKALSVLPFQLEDASRSNICYYFYIFLTNSFYIYYYVVYLFIVFLDHCMKL
jgi:lysyl-tRNA synthetase class II